MPTKKKHPQGVEQFADYNNAQANAPKQEQYITETPKFKTICSECYSLGCGSAYCPNCGAKMDEVEE